MSKFKDKIGKRIMAVILSGTMVMSGMTSSNMTTAFAAEVSNDVSTELSDVSYEETLETTVEDSDATASTETVDEVVSEVIETVTAEETKVETTIASEAETTVTAETEAAEPTKTEAATTVETEATAATETETTATTETETQTEITAETETVGTEVETETEIESETEKEEVEEDVSATKNAEGKIDVYDFGAEMLDDSIYNNILTEKVINSWYPDVAPGTMPKNIASWKVIDDDGNLLLEFSDGGNASTHRIRTTNKNLTRYDEKSLEFGGITYKG